ncbi:FHA domain-containing protein [Nocardia sp. NPDC049190]|uniref:FHA domain-containing protein n=1 Tax=Nocardia sp. NPDC049190 TaxID=3155650 RepID=UPI00340B90DD
MDASGLLAEVPSTVRDLVLGHWPETDVGGMRRDGDAYMQASRKITASADRYEAEARRTEATVSGAARDGMSERHRTVLQAMRNKAAVCESMGKQCYEVADATVQVQHLLVAMGIALAAQLAYDMLLFFQGGGAKALVDRLEAEEAMRAAAVRFTAEVGEHVAIGQVERTALHGAIHAAKIGGLTGAVTSAGAQVWDMMTGVRDEFDIGSFVELILGGALGGAAGAEVGRRVAPHVLELLGGRATNTAGRLATHMGGTVLIGGAGGLGGGVVGAVPSVLLHYKDIHSLEDLFGIIRSAAVTGFAGGFLGAATSSLRVHQAGRDAFRGDNGISRSGLRQQEFGTHVNELLRSGEAPRVETIARATATGDSAPVAKHLTFPDGTQVIHEVVSDRQHAHAQLLVSRVGDAVGVRMPAVHVVGDHVYTEVVPDHNLTRADVHQIRQRIDELRPAFISAGQPSLHDVVVQRLDALDARAVDTVDPRRSAAAPVTAPPRAGESPVRAPEANGRGPSGEGRDVSAQPRVDRPAPIPDHPSQGRPGTPPHHAGADVVADAPIPASSPVHPDADGPVVREADPHHEELLPHDGEPTDEGPPTLREIRIDPAEPSARDYELAAMPKPPGATSVYHHPDGYVDVVLSGPDGAQLPLRLVAGQEYVLGRGARSLLEHMATEGVSRQHVTVTVNEQGHVLIRDNESLNGTFVDGKQVVGENWVRVFDGQDLKLGREFELGLTFQRQMAEIRLFGDDGPSVRLYRGRTIDLGRSILHPDTPGRNTVSRHHAIVGMDENGRVWIQDSNSSNGTRVNGEELAPGEQRTLRPGDSVELGEYRGETQFVPADGAIEQSPVRVLIGMGPNATPVRLEPGHTVPVGTDENSPFAAHLRGVHGVDPRHATLGLDHDGRLWIRDHEGSAGVWVNGDRVAPNQKITLTEGDSVKLGPDFVGTTHIGVGDPADLGPVVLHFPPDMHRRPIHLEPGQERIVNIGELNGHTMVWRNGKPVGGHEVIVGRDLDGRVWVRDPAPGSFVRTEVNDETIPPNEKRYLDSDDKVNFDNVSARVQMGEESPLAVRLFDDADAPALSLRRGEEVKLGRGLDSPLAGHLTDLSVSRHHATIYRDEYGNVMLRDEHSTYGTWVDNQRVDPDAGPVRLRPGDTIRMGDWIGSAQFGGDGFREPPVRAVPIKLNSSHGELALDLVRGGEPVVLGRHDSRLPANLPHYDRISHRHASVGVHPSGRVWIRDEGSTNGTYVNGTKIKSGTMVTLRPGDHVSLGADAYDFTVGFTPAEGGPFVNVIDSTPQSRQVLQDLARIPDHVFQRVSDHMNAVPGGGIVIGKKPVAELPGIESLIQAHPEGPNDKLKWKNVAGLYSGGQRRFYVNSNFSDNTTHGKIVWHEFGHAADAAYGTGGRWLSEEQGWQDLHAAIKQEIGQHPDWWHYADTPVEGFAEGFAAWVAGPKQLLRFACGNKRIATQLEEYFDRAFT